MNLHAIVPPTAYVLSTAFIGLGCLHLLAPITTYNFFGLPVPRLRPQNVAEEKPVLKRTYSPSPFVYANGGREISLGITFFLLGYQNNREAIKAFMFALAVAAQVDAYVVWKYGGEEHGGWTGRWIMHTMGGLATAVIAWNEWGL